MNIKNTIFTLSLLTCAFAPIKAMEEKKIQERKHKIKLSYNNKPLSWRQTTAFLEAKMLKDMILDQESEYNGEEIAIDEIIHNTVHTENIYFKNNILDIIEIVPSSYLYAESLRKEHKNLLVLPDLKGGTDDLILINKNLEKKVDLLEKIETETKESVNNEISKIIKKYCYKDYQEDKIMDMIRCAQYIDSPVRNDLIEFALKNDLIDKRILESTDYTPKSLETIKNSEILDVILPLNTIDTLIEQRMGSEENIIIDVIKTVYYKTKKSEESEWLMTQTDKLDWKIKQTYEKDDCPPHTDSKFTLFDFLNMRLPIKIMLLNWIHNSIIEQEKKITTYYKNRTEYMHECLKDFLTTIHIPFIELALTLLMKKYFTSRIPIKNKIYFIPYLLQKYFLSAGAMLRSIKIHAPFPSFCVFSPFYQLMSLFKLINSMKKTDDTSDYIKKLYQDVKFLEHIKTTLENIIKNEYALKNNKK